MVLAFERHADWAVSIRREQCEGGQIQMTPPHDNLRGERSTCSSNVQSKAYHRTAFRGLPFCHLLLTPHFRDNGVIVRSGPRRRSDADETRSVHT